MVKILGDKARIINLKKAEMKKNFQGKIGEVIDLDLKRRRIILKLESGTVLKLKERSSRQCEEDA